MTDCTLAKKNMTLNKKYWKHVESLNAGTQNLEFDADDDNTFWVTTLAKNKQGKIEPSGKVRIRVDVVPKDKATKTPVGKARDEPNHSPHLPAPEGRMEFSLNPIKMFN